MRMKRAQPFVDKENFHDLVKHRVDLTGHCYSKAYTASVYQGKYDGANARPLVYKTRFNDGPDVISMSKSLLIQGAKLTTMPTGRWRLRIHEIIVLVCPDGKVFYEPESSPKRHQAQQTLFRTDFQRLCWEEPPF